MPRRFEIYQDAEHRRLAVPCGFSLTAAALDWVWALWLRLWLEASALFVVNALTTYLLVIAGAQWPAYAVLQVAQGLAVGFGARKLRSLSAERRGYAYLCTIDGVNGPNALAKLDAVGGTPLAEWRPRTTLAWPDLTPRGLQGLVAVARLTLKAAFRFRPSD